MNIKNLYFFSFIIFVCCPLVHLCFAKSRAFNEGLCQDATIRNGVFWTDSMHFPCQLYEGAEWCTPEGEKGPGWDSFWGNFHGFISHGMTCKDACCGCGGGNKNPETFDENLPVYDGVPEYPYDLVDYHFTADDHSARHCHKCIEGNIWNDSWGYSCLAYHYGNFCTTDGGTGPGWHPSYGPIESYRNAQRDAFGACGACGFDE